MQMNGKIVQSIRVGAGLFALLALAVVMPGQDNTAAHHISVVDDWSNHHMVFSTPVDMATAVKIQQNPRYWQQFYRRNAHTPVTAAAALGYGAPPKDEVTEADEAARAAGPGMFGEKAETETTGLKNDWAINLGAAASLPGNTYPVKWTYNVTAPPSCASDFVVFPTGQTGSGGAEATDSGDFTAAPGNTTTATVTNGANSEKAEATSASGAMATVTFSGSPTAAQTIVFVDGAHTVTLTACTTRTGGCGSGTTFYVCNFECNTLNATALATAIANNGSTVGITASSSAAVVTITATAIGTGGNSIVVTNNLKNTTPMGTFDLSGGGTLQPQGSSCGANCQYFQVSNSTGTALSLSTIASNFASALNNNAAVGVTIAANSPSSGDVTVTANAPGTAGNSIALTSTLTNFTWTNPTLTGGVNANADIVAFYKLYQGTCSATVPSVYFSYNTSSSGQSATVTTSPAISLDGTQVVLVQSANSEASLVLLKPPTPGTAGQGTIGGAVTPTIEATGAAYRACAAPCMLILPFDGTPNDTLSSPYYDFVNDIVYVGDNSGKVHKFTGVFLGTPAETTTGGWPAAVGSGGILNSPLYDQSSNQIIVGDANTTGKLYRFLVTAPGTVTATAAIDTHQGIVDEPLVDGSAGSIYVFVADNGTNAAVEQFSITFAAGASPAVKAAIGSTSTTVPIYAGAFDDAYFTSANDTGHIYVCGVGPNAFTVSTRYLFQVTITANVLQSTGVVQGSALTSSAGAECGPVTEAFSNSNDYLFLSVANNKSIPSAICGTAAGGCVFSYNLTSSAFAAGKAPNGSGLLTGTTPNSAIIIDNVSTATGASNVYFLQPTGGNETNCTPVAAGSGCAVQAAQSAL
jgi:hypothetical protein